MDTGSASRSEAGAGHVPYRGHLPVRRAGHGLGHQGGGTTISVMTVGRRGHPVKAKSGANLVRSILDSLVEPYPQVIEDDVLLVAW